MSVPYSVYKTLPKSAQKAIRDSAAAKKSKPRAAPRARAPAVVRAPRSTTRRSSWVDHAAAALPGLALAGMKLAGFGDYAPMTAVPRENSFMKELMTNGPPSIHNTSQRTFIVRHREYLGDIVTGASPAFTINSFAINPGLRDSFPWLAQIAQNFEQYRIRGMVYEFKSTSADALNSTNTALGTVIMATEYNSDSLPFVTKAQMENHEFASSCRQSCSMLHAIECAPRATSISELYTRQGEPPSGQDLRLYDLGRFSIATAGQQGANVTIGELWCSYEIELLKPQIPDVLTSAETDHVWSVTAVSTSAYFGTSQTTYSDQIGCTFTTNSIVFPDDIASGKYLVSLNWYNPGGAFSGCTAPTPAFVGLNAYNGFSDNTVSSLAVNATGLATTSTSLVLAVELTQPGGYVSLSGGSLPLGATVQVDAIVTRLGDL